MAPKIRSAGPITPQKPKSSHTVYTTRHRIRFFDAWDTRAPGLSLRQFCQDRDPDFGTASRWLRQRNTFGSPAYRRTRRLSNKLGRPPIVSKEQCQMLVSPLRNPVRDQAYKAQIEFHKLGCKKRSLQARLKACTKGGQRYKQAYIKKEISRQNKRKRQYIFFSDEAHLDTSSQAQGYILREQGTRTDAENIQERGERTGVKLHVFAWVNWWGKSKLYFYHDEEEYIERPPRPPKPRTRKYETTDEFEARLREWEASLPQEQVVKPKGNAMTQKYYTETLLPVHAKALHQARLVRPNGELKRWLFQEDGDPSHGKKKRGMAQVYLDSNWIPTLVHPPQSPDLNPTEEVRNILKQRVRRRTWRNIEEYKAVCQDEWDKITLEEVRARIIEMLDRCKSLVKTGGAAIKSDLW
ncbi:uncharacterized protein BP5553_02393 [Venustampulla echinocandica]|uniref:Tc1-like transposase DDE domain-containing protein n=1 Tax=Venustampulla echinocandica TaxID=2656787 RepID=A0A370U3S1_9HELO|nr:uncharacterized protein BP5553_02393 [Venustampulla echinocandica]RDL42414.1 hypothetical protein BP5553_02393 [Venustampulla echinocandica]